MVTKTKTRGTSYVGYTKFHTDPEVAVNVPGSTFTDDLIFSQGNPGPPYRSGVGFSVRHSISDLGHQEVLSRKGFYQYRGMLYASLPPLSPYATPTDMSTLLFGLGSRGYALARPDRPVASIAQMIGEMKDFTSQGGISRRGLNPVKNAASDFLGYEFGAKPLLNDIKALYNLQSNLAKKYAFLVNNNGKNIRRRITLGETIESSSLTQSGVWIGPSTNTLFAPYVRSITHLNEKKYWYTGSFRFYVPELSLPPGSWSRRLLAAQAGGAIDAKLLYELMPWSWLSDWFGTFGDALGNLSNFGIDHLVQNYGFVMGTNTVRSTATNPAIIGSSTGSQRLLTITSKREIVFKQRVAGYPYGFGSNPQSLSLRQGAILAALGLSRL